MQHMGEYPVALTSVCHGINLTNGYRPGVRDPFTDDNECCFCIAFSTLVVFAMESILSVFVGNYV